MPRWDGLSVAQRLTAGLIRMPSGCLEWTGNTDRDGYGVISVKDKSTRAHRLAWELANGPIPAGLCVLHHCDNPPCCDVEKCLFLGTNAENVADRHSKGRGSRHNSSTTHCPQNHIYDETNTYITPNGCRNCRVCNRDAVARYKGRKLGKVPS